MRTAVVLLVLAIVHTAAADPKVITSKEGRYSVKFPAAPAASTRAIPNTDMKTTVYLLQQGDDMYMALYTDAPKELKSSVKQQLDDSEQGALANGKVKLVSHKDLTYQGYPARDLVITDARERVMKMRLVIVGLRMYQVMAVRVKGADFASGDAFIASLKIMK